MKRNAFTMIELLVILSVIGILAAVVFPVLHSVHASTQRANCQSNLHQIGQSLAMYTSDYDDTLPPASGGTFDSNLQRAPELTCWYTLLIPYLHAKQPLVCPGRSLLNPFTAGHDACFSGYAYNFFLGGKIFHQHSSKFHYVGSALSGINFPSATISVGDARAGLFSLMLPDSGDKWEEVGSIALADYHNEIRSLPPGAERHLEGANYLFMDNRVKWLRSSQIKQYLPNLGEAPTFFP